MIRKVKFSRVTSVNTKFLSFHTRTVHLCAFWWNKSLELLSIGILSFKKNIGILYMLIILIFF